MTNRISRRSALCGCLGLAGVTCTTGMSFAASEDQSEEFICSSIPFPDDDPEIAKFSSETLDIATGVDSEFNTTEFGVFSARKRWRKSDGLTKGTGLITLGVHFYNGTKSEQQRLIKRASGWIDERLSKQLVFKFGVTEEEAQIRVHFSNSGPNNSAIGRDALHKHFKKKPTLRIRNMHSVAHEFGHALGLLHEHRHEEIPFTFAEDKVIAEMRRPPNKWTESKTRRNILRPNKGSKCVGDQGFNEDSVMIYQIPKRWTVEGVSFSPNRNISQRDRNCIYAVYEA